MLFLILRLLTTSLVIKIIATFRRIPAGNIDTFARLFALKNGRRIGFSKAFALLVNPFPSVRYFEFDFVQKHLVPTAKDQILDISSPRIFGLFFASKYRNIAYTMANPDKKDIAETKLFINKIYPNISLSTENALSLPFRANSFDAVISISVLEHIEGKGDTKAVLEMFRVLRHGGKLIITSHVAKNHRNEFRKIDQYGLGHKKIKGKYFFQRIYSNKTLQQRIISAIGDQPISQEIIGEKHVGWFDGYIKVWNSSDFKKSIKTTVYDPYYTMTKFKKFSSINELPGVGVIGLVFKKPA